MGDGLVRRGLPLEDGFLRAGRNSSKRENIDEAASQRHRATSQHGHSGCSGKTVSTPVGLAGRSLGERAAGDQSVLEGKAQATAIRIVLRVNVGWWC